MVEANPLLRVFEDDLVTLDQADFCVVPGYLVLRVKVQADSLAQLDPAAAGRVGIMLSRALGAIERAVAAERVYCLSFCEVDRRLHFHLFPRSRGLLEEYHRATATEAVPVNGAAIFEWARDTYRTGREPPAGSPSLEDACVQLRACLRRPDCSRFSA